MSALSRRPLVTTAAALPALAVPAVAVAAHSDPQLLALGEQLKPLWAKRETLYRQCDALREEAAAAAVAVHGTTKGWGTNNEAMREFKRVADKNGYSRLFDALSDVDKKVHEIAEAILEIPATDRIDDGIHAAAALALDTDKCERELVDLLWKMAERAGFARPEETVQS